MNIQQYPETITLQQAPWVYRRVRDEQWEVVEMGDRGRSFATGLSAKAWPEQRSGVVHVVSLRFNKMVERGERTKFTVYDI